MANPYASMVAPPANPYAGMVQGFTPLTAPNPKLPLEIRHQQGENIIQQGEIDRQGSLTSKAKSDASKSGADAAHANIDLRFAGARNQAALTKEQTEAALAQQKVDETRANAALATMTPNSNVHGEAYFDAIHLPESQRVLARAYARGDLGSRAGGLTTSMLPIIQHAMNYDPTTSATTFPARVKMQQDLAGNQPGSLGGSLRAMERMLLHGHEVMNAGQALDNFGPGLVGRVGNAVRTGYEQFTRDPGVGHYEQLVRNYAPEAQKAIAQTSGGQAERQDRAEGFSASDPQATRVGALQADSKQAFDAMAAANDQYRRLMGRDITDQLSPDARQAYDRIMAGGYDAQGKALHPADGYSPMGLSGGRGSPPAPPPAFGGQPGGAPPGSPPSGPAAPQMTLATGAYRSEPFEQGSRLIDAMVRSGASDDQIDAALTAIGSDKIDRSRSAEVRAFLAKNPGYKGLLGAATRSVPTTGWERIAASPVGTGILSAVDGAMGGTSDEAAGAIDALVNGRPFSAAIADANARKQAAFATNWKSALLGNMVGGTAGYVGAGKLLGAAGLGLDLGRATPYAGAAAYNALSGAGQDNDNRTAGAVIGGLTGPLGHGLGELAAIPVGAAARGVAGSAPARAMRGMFGRGPDPIPQPLNPGQSAYLNGVNGVGADNLRASLAEAQRLGVPMSPADAAPQLASLAGAAVRRSPDAAAYAEAQLFPRSRGQIDRFGAAIARDLGPVANIPEYSLNLTRQAQEAAAPLYAKAYGNPVPTTPEIDALLSTPFGRQALGRARTIAANERRSPSELGFGLDADGNPVLNPRPNDLIAKHLDARAELDAAQDAYRTARTSPGTSMDAARDRLLAARDSFRQADQALAAAPDPSAAASVPAYTQQTLDYVKRGMDDILEQQRNPITGKLVLDEAGRAQNDVRAGLLKENDKLNPDFAAARAAYAGPAAARDALARGQDAFSLSPDQLGMQVAGQSPEHLAQMQTGFRSELMNRANAVRDVSNPFEATLGSPAARARVDALYPNNPGTVDLFRTRDLEGQLARTQDEIRGNSKTAGRSIADKAFLGGFGPAAAVDVALAGHGQAPLATMAYGLGGGAAKRFVEGQMASRAITRADQMAPLLMNPDPAASTATLDSLLAQAQAYQNYARSFRPTAQLGMFGRSAGGALSTMPN